MEPILAALISLIIGVALGLVIAAVSRRRAEQPPVETFEVEVPVVPAGVSEMLAILKSSGIVVGLHDEVLEATSSARTMGLVRGTRVAPAELLELIRTARRNQSTLEVELCLAHGAPGAVTYFAVRVAPFDGNLMLVLAEDQTASRRIEETRHDFIANVSHELKTPIGAISLLAEAVEDAAEDPEAVLRFANRMGIESARLTDLVGQIIDLSHLQADHPLTDPEVVDIDEVLLDAVDRQRVDAERHAVTLTLAGVGGATVLGSARQLGVAVGNLVENAVVYSDPGARVVVAARVLAEVDDDYVEITVSDTGIGIATADAARIFERFYRVDYARSRANGGTGLGLSIVKHVAAIHGGEVLLWSQVGRGSTFAIKIPAHLGVGLERDSPSAVTALQPDSPLGAGSLDEQSDQLSQELNR